MTVHDRAAKTYKTLNDAGRSHDECLREAVNAVLSEILGCRTFTATSKGGLSYAGWNITKLNKLVGNDGKP